MNKLTVGVIAHVDAGKTTLSEGILYRSGEIGKLGRVDHQNTFLDHHHLERSRGITIFSKQAIFNLAHFQVTLLDTPGHADFSAEMERTLQVLDYAILVIDGTDGVQGHTRTLWWLLDYYRIPVFIFVNKMDRDLADQEALSKELSARLSDGCIDFGRGKTVDFYDKLAMCNEEMMNTFLKKGSIEVHQIKEAVRERTVFPCFFGSALRMEGIGNLLRCIEKYMTIPEYPDDFGARVFKITRDGQGNRLTHIKLTGGRLKVKDILSNGSPDEKVNQIRFYSGNDFESAEEAEAGTICALTGCGMSKPGEGFGFERDNDQAILEPVLSYQVILPEDTDAKAMIPKLRQIEEEEPALHVSWNEQTQEIQVQIMGEVQIEILKYLIEERYGILVDFGMEQIVYRETIANTVEGVGHFEPLRHYAEVHLLLEPLESESGLVFDSVCSTDVLSRNWQRLILTHLKEKNHKGVLTGSDVTDMKITVVSGRAHNKHTEGGDFRAAAYRAVRQGLKEAESVLLEPYYSFQLELPEKMLGRAMTDVERMKGTCKISNISNETAVLIGSVPVVTMRNYQKEVAAYTKGSGRLVCVLEGYKPCHNEEEIIEKMGYDSERDVGNPAGSVFCSHGESFSVGWDKVKDYMHVEAYRKEKEELSGKVISPPAPADDGEWMDFDEIDDIFNRTFYANRGKKSGWKKRESSRESYYRTGSDKQKNQPPKEEYLLVDGYNIIHAWPELKELSDGNMDGARMKLSDILSNYQGVKKCRILIVFDAYRVKGGSEKLISRQNIDMLFTGEAQTADQYIEKFVLENIKKYRITVATSDGLQQIMVRGSGGYLLSARELKHEIESAVERAKTEYKAKPGLWNG